jgi:hypothetical protein
MIALCYPLTCEGKDKADDIAAKEKLTLDTFPTATSLQSMRK